MFLFVFNSVLQNPPQDGGPGKLASCRLFLEVPCGCGSKAMGSHFGAGAPPILVYFGDFDPWPCEAQRLASEWSVFTCKSQVQLVGRVLLKGSNRKQERSGNLSQKVSSP